MSGSHDLTDPTKWGAKPDVTVWCEDDRHHEQPRCVAVFSWYNWRDVGTKLVDDPRWLLDQLAQWGPLGASESGGLAHFYEPPTTSRARRLSTAETWGWWLRCADPCPQSFRAPRDPSRRALDQLAAHGPTRLSLAGFRFTVEHFC